MRDFCLAGKGPLSTQALKRATPAQEEEPNERGKGTTGTATWRRTLISLPSSPSVDCPAHHYPGVLGQTLNETASIDVTEEPMSRMVLVRNVTQLVRMVVSATATCQSGLNLDLVSFPKYG